MNYSIQDLKIQLQDIREWLVMLDGRDEYLGFLAGMQKELLDQAVKAGDEARADRLIENLLSDSKSSRDTRDVAAVYVECGFVLFTLGQKLKKPAYFKRAVECLQKAMERYGGSRMQRTLVGWARGYMFWAMTGYADQARSAWNSCIEEIKFIVKYPLPAEIRSETRDFYGLYEKWIEKMKNDLSFAVKELDQPSTPPSQKAQPLPTSPKAVTKFFPIMDTIRAGRFGAVGYETVPDSFLEIEIGAQVENAKVDDTLYKVNGLRSGKYIRLLDVLDYDVLRVRGDSMNQMGIEEGDYVILRKQAAAENQDIVAAQVFDADAYATLKRYVEQGRNIILRPESSNPQYKEMVFTNPGEEFSIRGIALAVLKPA